MKRVMAFLLAALMLCSVLPVTASAAGQADQAEKGKAAAEALYDLGLFLGTGTHNDGSPEFDLGSAPNRAQAITMLVRLLGKEEEAKNGTWTTPFTDVPGWARPYVGYAYANGLTMGISDTLFGSQDLVTAAQYLTFVLRALGYTDKNQEDFYWSTAAAKADELGITSGEYTGGGEFLRGDLAIISYNTLFTTYKNSTETMLEALADAGAVDMNTADGLKFYRVLDAVSAEHEAAVTAPIDTSTLSKYTVNDSSTANLLTDSEIRALLESSAHQSTVSRAQAESDVDLFFRMLRSAYCAYYYFGQDQFETAEKNVKQWVAQFSTVNVSDLEQKIADEMSFARDAHAIFGAAPDESSTRYEYFYVKDLRLYKGEDGYYKLDNGERWYLKTISDARVSLELTLMDDGELVYAPVLLVPGTEVKSCTITYQNEAGRTKSETVNWTEGQAYSGFQTRPDVKSFQEQGIQYISVRSFMGEYGMDLQAFVDSGKEAKTAKAIIFDLRGNHGGNDGYGQSWMRNFIGKEARYTVAVGNRYSKLRAAAWNEGEGLAGQFVRYEQTGTFLPNDIPIIVLVDDGCASSGESMLNFLKTMDNTIVIGTNSGGYQLCGNNISVTLPNTGIYAYFGVSLTFPFVMENVDRKGYAPDVWCSADTSLEAVLNMMVRYNVTDQATADKVAGKAIVKYENVTLKYGNAVVRPGETCGCGQGEHVLYPMLDGKAITDYTYTMSSNGVLTHSRAADGGIKVQVVGGGYETITVTVHGTDYRFRWFSDAASSDIGEIPEGDLTLGFIDFTVKPGERFGAWKWMYYIDVLVGGQKVTDFTYTVEKDGILYHQKTRDGRIAVTVIGNGEAPFIIHYNGEDYPFIWVTEGFDGDVCVPEDPENFTLEWLGMDIYPGASFGSWAGSYRLIPMLDGKPITNFTYTNADKSVIRDRLLDDGTVEVTVVGDGHAKLTFTVNGKDYSFYWAAFTP